MDQADGPSATSDLIASLLKMAPQTSSMEDNYDCRMFADAAAELLKSITGDIDELRDENQEIRNQLKNQVDMLAELSTKINEMKKADTVKQVQLVNSGIVTAGQSPGLVGPPLFDGTFNAEVCREFVASMKQYFEGLEIDGNGLTEEEKVNIIGGQLRGPALRFWTARASGRVSGEPTLNPVADNTIARAAYSSGQGQDDTGNTIMAEYLPKTALEAFKLLTNRYCLLHPGVPVKWARIRHKHSVAQLDSICQEAFRTTIPAPTRRDLKNKFYGTLREEIRHVMIHQMDFTMHELHAHMSYEKLVQFALTAEKMIFTNPEAYRGNAVEVARPAILPPKSGAVVSKTATPVLPASKVPTGPSSSTSATPVVKKPFGAQMPKKGTVDWTRYCRMRNACYTCGQLSHASNDCRSYFAANHGVFHGQGDAGKMEALRNEQLQLIEQEDQQQQAQQVQAPVQTPIQQGQAPTQASTQASTPVPTQAPTEAPVPQPQEQAQQSTVQPQQQIQQQQVQQAQQPQRQLPVQVQPQPRLVMPNATPGMPIQQAQQQGGIPIGPKAYQIAVAASAPHTGPLPMQQGFTHSQQHQGFHPQQHQGFTMPHQFQPRFNGQPGIPQYHPQGYHAQTNFNAFNAHNQHLFNPQHQLNGFGGIQQHQQQHQHQPQGFVPQHGFVTQQHPQPQPQPQFNPQTVQATHVIAPAAPANVTITAPYVPASITVVTEEVCLIDLEDH